MAELFREMAFINISGGTRSEMRDCLLGMLNANKEPFTTPMAMRCQNRTRPVRSKVARTRVMRPFPTWLNMTMYLRGNRSANEPPMGDMIVMGSAKAIMTSESARGESSGKPKDEPSPRDHLHVHGHER